MRVLVTSIFLGLLSPLEIAAAGPDYSDVDLRAWIRVHTERAGVGHSPSPGEYVSDDDVLVTKGGALFSNASVRSDPVGLPTEFETVVVRGLGTPGERSNLAAAIGLAQLGVQEDCSIAGDPGVPAKHEITWYGKSPRRHAFTIRTVDGNVERPTCPTTLSRFLVALGLFHIRVLEHPDTEVLSSIR